MLIQYETGKRFRIFELCVPEFQSILFRLYLEILYQCSACHTFLFQRVSSNQPVQCNVFGGIKYLYALKQLTTNMAVIVGEEETILFMNLCEL